MSAHSRLTFRGDPGVPWGGALCQDLSNFFLGRGIPPPCETWNEQTLTKQSLFPCAHPHSCVTFPRSLHTTVCIITQAPRKQRTDTGRRQSTGNTSHRGRRLCLGGVPAVRVPASFLGAGLWDRIISLQTPSSLCCLSPPLRQTTFWWLI